MNLLSLKVCNFDCVTRSQRWGPFQNKETVKMASIAFFFPGPGPGQGKKQAIFGPGRILQDDVPIIIIFDHISHDGVNGLRTLDGADRPSIILPRCLSLQYLQRSLKSAVVSS